MRKVVIDGREISAAQPPYVIAEMSGNHNGDIERAKSLIAAAKEAGADAVKLQTYTPDTITIQSDRPEFRIEGGLWNGRSLYELYQEAHTPLEWHAPLFAHARQLGITIFSSVFDDSSVDLLESLDTPAYKIASAEIIDWGLLEKVAGTGKPIIVSTGMANNQEIAEALEVLRGNGATQIIVLHCVSAYPTPVEAAQLRRIRALEEKFDVLVGLSDHTMGIVVPTAATVAGACVIEKHFTLARADGGVDSEFSLERGELADMCRSVRDAFASLGTGAEVVNEAEEATKNFRRSLYFVKPLAAGEVISSAHLRSIRPGIGLLPRHRKDLIGRKAARDIASGTPADWSLVS